LTQTAARERRSTEGEFVRIAALVLIGIHAAVLAGHDSAHRGLGVDLVLWQTVYAYTLIVAGPLLAAGLLVAARMRAGFAVLAISMLAALSFGAFFHYVAVSPDHVSHLPHGPEQPLFRSTAALMAILELAGVGFGWWGYRKSR
jgi:hypothetical protein